jgi:hypothetical protein
MRRLALLGIVTLVGAVALLVAFRPGAPRATSSANFGEIHNPGEAADQYRAWSPAREAREAPARKVIAPPRFVERTQSPMTDQALPLNADSSTVARGDPERTFYAQLHMPPEQEQRVRDVLRIMRERAKEIGLTRRGLSREEFTRLSRELKAETDANLAAVLRPDQQKELNELSQRDGERLVRRMAESRSASRVKRP